MSMRRSWIALVLAVACALTVTAVDLAVPVRAQGGDTTPGRLGAVALACARSLDLREIDWVARAADRGGLPYWAQRARDGSIRSTFGPGPALVASIGMRSLQPGTTLRDRALMRRARYGAALALATSALLLYLALLAHASPRRALSGALVAALSFAGGATVGQAPWQLTAALPPMMGALACIAWSPRSRIALALAPALVVVATFARPTSIGATAGLAVAWIVAVRASPRGAARARAIAVSVVLAALVAAPFVASNLRLFGSPFPSSQLRAALAIPGEQAVFSLSPSRFVPALAALVASPGRGLLFFAPIVLVALALVVVAVRAHGVRAALRDGSPARAVVLGVVLQLVLAAAYRFWWGGVCFGPRFVAEAVWLGAFVAFAAPWPERRALVAIAWAASAWTIAVGLLGLVRYDAQLWDLRRAVNQHPDVVWDPIDSPLAAIATRPRPEETLLDGEPGPFAFCRPRALVDLVPPGATRAAPNSGL